MRSIPKRAFLKAHSLLRGNIVCLAVEVQCHLKPRHRIARKTYLWFVRRSVGNKVEAHNLSVRGSNHRSGRGSNHRSGRGSNHRSGRVRENAKSEYFGVVKDRALNWDFQRFCGHACGVVKSSTLLLTFYHSIEKNVLPNCLKPKGM